VFGRVDRPTSRGLDTVLSGKLADSGLIGCYAAPGQLHLYPGACSRCDNTDANGQG
jgi:hypothetical protein